MYHAHIIHKPFEAVADKVCDVSISLHDVFNGDGCSLTVTG